MRGGGGGDEDDDEVGGGGGGLGTIRAVSSIHGGVGGRLIFRTWSIGGIEWSCFWRRVSAVRSQLTRTQTSSVCARRRF